MLNGQEIGVVQHLIKKHGGGSGGSVSSKPNFAKDIEANEWIIQPDGMYKCTVNHKLESKDIFVNFYEENTQGSLTGVEIVTTNEINIYNNVAIKGRVVVNGGYKEPVTVNLQTRVDENLATSDKTIVGAINETNSQLEHNTSQLEEHLANHPSGGGADIDDVNISTTKVYSNSKTKSLVDEVAQKGTTVEVLERVTKEEIDRQIADGTIANLTITDDSITQEKLKDDIISSNKLMDSCIRPNHLHTSITQSGKFVDYRYNLKSDSGSTNTFLVLGFGVGADIVTDGTKGTISFKITSDTQTRLKLGVGAFNQSNPNFDFISGWSGFNINVNETLLPKVPKSILGDMAVRGVNANYDSICIVIGTPSDDVADRDVYHKLNEIELDINGTIYTPTHVGFYMKNMYSHCTANLTDVPDNILMSGVRELIENTPLKEQSVGVEHFTSQVIPQLKDKILNGSVVGVPEIIYEIPDSIQTISVSSRGATYIIGKPYVGLQGGCLSDITMKHKGIVTLGIFKKVSSSPHTFQLLDFIKTTDNGNTLDYSTIVGKSMLIPENEVYLGLTGCVGFKSISSSDVINSMYSIEPEVDFTNPDDTATYSSTLSGMKLWFDLKVSASKEVFNVAELNKQLDTMSSTLIRVQNEVKELREMVENGVGSGIGSDLSDNPVNNLRVVWDIELTSTDTTWAYSNCSPTPDSYLKCTGVAKAYYNQYLTFDTFKQKVKVTLDNINSKFGIICHNNESGALYLIDGINNTISLHSNYTGGGIPVVKASTPIPFQLVQGRDYIITVVKTGWKHTLTLADSITFLQCSVEFDNALQVNGSAYCGNGWGGVGVASFEGSVTFLTHQYQVALHPKAKVLFIGDSITEGTNMGAGTDIKYRWCSLLRDNYFKYNAIICGRGGATSNDVLSRLNSLESLGVKADIVVVLDGTNERSQSATDNWKVVMPQIRNKIISWGAKPIICVPPVPNSGWSYLAQMRDFILENKWETIRFDLATSKDNDGVTYDSTLYTDGVHPNGKGGEFMFERAVKDLNLIF